MAVLAAARATCSCRSTIRSPSPSWAISCRAARVLLAWFIGYALQPCHGPAAADRRGRALPALQRLGPGRPATSPGSSPSTASRCGLGVAAMLALGGLYRTGRGRPRLPAPAALAVTGPVLEPGPAAAGLSLGSASCSAGRCVAAIGALPGRRRHWRWRSWPLAVIDWALAAADLVGPAAAGGAGLRRLRRASTPWPASPA